jgi:hypothetical protein
MESEFQRLIGYQFQDQGLMEEALEEAGPASAGNERLALLGDNILSIMLLRRWYREGDTTGRSIPFTTRILLIQYRARDGSTSGLRLQQAIDLSG